MVAPLKKPRSSLPFFRGRGFDVSKPTLGSFSLNPFYPIKKFRI